MIISDRNDWVRQVRLLNIKMEIFQESPTREHQEALIREMAIYAQAVDRGMITIPCERKEKLDFLKPRRANQVQAP